MCHEVGYLRAAAAPDFTAIVLAVVPSVMIMWLAQAVDAGSMAP